MTFVTGDVPSHVSRAAVVTGASQGIGRAVAARLAREGFHVWAMARRAAALGALAASDPVRIHVCPVDLSARDSQALSEAAAMVQAPLDALIHCAGAISTGPLVSVDPDDVRWLVEVNAIAALRVTQCLRPRLQSGSSIIFVNSSQGLAAGGGVGGYAASKHALKAIADSLRSDMTGTGIRVTTLYLGRTATPMQQRLYAERAEAYRPEFLVQPETIAQIIHTVITLPAEAEVTDVSVRPSFKSY